MAVTPLNSSPKKLASSLSQEPESPKSIEKKYKQRVAEYEDAAGLAKSSGNPNAEERVKRLYKEIVVIRKENTEIDFGPLPKAYHSGCCVII